MSKRPRTSDETPYPELTLRLFEECDGSRVLLLVCKRWHSAITGFRPQWHTLLRIPLLCVLGKERIITLSQRPVAYQTDLALLCDSVVRQGHFDTDLGAQCVALVQRYYDDCTPLSISHHHAKDMRITFREEGHLYTVMVFERTHYILRSNDTTSAQPWPSATGWLGTLFHPFVTHERALACESSPRQSDPSYRYYKMKYDQICEYWVQTSVYGTNRHGNMELCLNGLPHDTTGEEWHLWLEFKRAHIDGKLTPWRSEQKLWSRRLRMVGSDDITWIYIDERKRYTKEGRLIVVLMDFKFCQDVRHSSFDDASGIVPCTAHTPDCNASRWGIQVHLYRTILEEYGYCVEPVMSDIVLHPSQKTYIKEDFKFDERFSRLLIAHRLGEIAKQPK